MMETEAETDDTSVFESPPFPSSKFTKCETVYQADASSHDTSVTQSCVTSDDANQKVLKYTTSIATISTPKNAIRVASRKKPPFTAETFMLSMCPSPRDTIISNVIPWSKTLDLPKPTASSTPQCSVRRRNPPLPDGTGNSTDSILCYETTSLFVLDENYRKCIERLERKVVAEEHHIAESKKKVSFWKRKDSKNSMNELCAQALLLISKSRLRTYQELVTRVQTLHRMSIVPPSIAKPLRASFTIYSMQINLCKNYYINGPSGSDNYVFLVTFSTGEKVIATEIIRGNEGESIRARRLRVDEPVHLVGLPISFQVKMEIFALKLNNRTSNSPKELAKKAFNFFGNCRSPAGAPQKHDDSSDEDENESGFKSVGYAYLTRDLDGHNVFLISENEYPLDGSMEMKSEVSALPNGLTDELTGYWNFCGDSGYTKLWIKMSKGLIHCFNHPDQTDDYFIEPCNLIDMSTICNRKVEREVNVFKDAKYQFTFYMDVLTFPRGSDLCEHKRFFIALETEEQLKKWLSKINLCLEIIRGTSIE